jgi:hypothetical protein
MLSWQFTCISPLAAFRNAQPSKLGERNFHLRPPARVTISSNPETAPQLAEWLLFHFYSDGEPLYVGRLIAMSVQEHSAHAFGFHNLPANVVDQILHTLSLADCVRLSATCKKIGMMTKARFQGNLKLALTHAALGCVINLAQPTSMFPLKSLTAHV